MGKRGGEQRDLLDTASVEASPDDEPTSVLEYDLFNISQW